MGTCYCPVSDISNFVETTLALGDGKRLLGNTVGTREERAKSLQSMSRKYQTDGMGSIEKVH